MLRFLNLFVSITLVLLVCINGLTSDVFYVEPEIVKASNGPMRIKPSIYNTDGGRSYAYAQLAVPFIKDEIIRKKVASFTWCGTPTWEYFAYHPWPTKDQLRIEATLLEAKYNK
jgi:hypothetical protein